LTCSDLNVALSASIIMPISNVILTLAAATAFDEVDAAAGKADGISAMFANHMRSHEDDLKKLHDEMSVDTA
jgi:hypothetical protein